MYIKTECLSFNHTCELRASPSDVRYFFFTKSERIQLKMWTVEQTPFEDVLIENSESQSKHKEGTDQATLILYALTTMLSVHNRTFRPFWNWLLTRRWRRCEFGNYSCFTYSFAVFFSFCAVISLSLHFSCFAPCFEKFSLKTIISKTKFSQRTVGTMRAKSVPQFWLFLFSTYRIEQNVFHRIDTKSSTRLD